MHSTSISQLMNVVETEDEEAQTSCTDTLLTAMKQVHETIEHLEVCVNVPHGHVTVIRCVGCEDQGHVTGIPRRQPHRRSGLAILPSVGAIP